MTVPASTPAPQPQPPQHGVLDTLRDLPRWAIVAVVVAAGLIAYYIYTVSKAADPAQGTWAQNAQSLLISRGYPPNQVNSAVNNYLNGQQLTENNVAIISEAVRALGTPDMPNTQPIENTTSITPSGTDDTATATVNPSDTSYWYVYSLGAGWSSTLRGIAQQFYGNTSQSYILINANPGIVANDYSRIPAGIRIKVPRSTLV